MKNNKPQYAKKRKGLPLTPDEKRIRLNYYRRKNYRRRLDSMSPEERKAFYAKRNETSKARYYTLPPLTDEQKKAKCIYEKERRRKNKVKQLLKEKKIIDGNPVPIKSAQELGDQTHKIRRHLNNERSKKLHKENQKKLERERLKIKKQQDEETRRLYVEMIEDNKRKKELDEKERLRLIEQEKEDAINEYNRLVEEIKNKIKNNNKK